MKKKYSEISISEALEPVKCRPAALIAGTDQDWLTKGRTYLIMKALDQMSCSNITCII